jgi:hypothetical protein
MISRLASLFAVVLVLIATSVSAAFADEAFRLQNLWRQSFIGVDNGSTLVLRDSADQPDTTWTLETVPGDTPYYRLRASSGGYLNVESGKPVVGPVQPGWWSAMWMVQPLPDGYSRLISRWKAGQGLHTERGSIEIGEYGDGWLSAMWKLQPVEQAAQATGSQGTAAEVVVGLTVNNRSSQPIDIIFYDDIGSAQRLATVSPNYAMDLKSFANITWLFQTSAGGVVKSYTTTAATQQTVELSQQDVAGAGTAPQLPPTTSAGGQSGGAAQGATAGVDPTVCLPADGSRGQRTRMTSPKIELSSGRATETAGVNRMFQMVQDGSCAVTYSLQPFVVEQPTSGVITRESLNNMPEVVRGIMRSALVNGQPAEARLEFTPSVVAWIDDETDELFVTLDTGENFFLQLDNSYNQNLSRGPFLKSADIVISTPSGFSVRKRWPVNNQTSTSVSKSQGFSLNANLNVSPMVAMFGAGVGAGLNFDTTTSRLSREGHNAAGRDQLSLQALRRRLECARIGKLHLCEPGRPDSARSRRHSRPDHGAARAAAARLRLQSRPRNHDIRLRRRTACRHGSAQGEHELRVLRRLAEQPAAERCAGLL